LFSQTFYGLLFSYLTMTDVTSHVHHKFPVSFLLYIATKNTCQINQIIAVNSSMNASISGPSHKKNNSCTPCVPMFNQATMAEDQEFQWKEPFLAAEISVLVQKWW